MSVTDRNHHLDSEEADQEVIRPPCRAMFGFMAHSLMDAKELGREDPKLKTQIMGSRQKASDICGHVCAVGRCINELGGDRTPKGEYLSKVIISAVDLRGQEIDPEADEGPYWELELSDFE